MEYYISFIGYAFAILASPGPNNIILMTSSSNFGYRKVMPTLFGIWFGFSVLILLSTSSIGVILIQQKIILTILKYISVAYLIYLAYKIIKTNGIEGYKGKPISFIEMAFLQLSNPKGWIVAVTTSTTFWREDIGYLFNISIILGILLIVSIISNSFWVLLGIVIKNRMPTIIYRIFNVAMGIILIVSVLLVLWNSD